MTLLAPMRIVTVDHCVTFWIPPFYQACKGRPWNPTTFVCAVASRWWNIFTQLQSDILESRGVWHFTLFTCDILHEETDAVIFAGGAIGKHISGGQHGLLSTLTEKKIELVFLTKLKVVQKQIILWSLRCELCPLDWALFTGDQCDNRCSPSPHRPLFVAF